MTEEQPEPHPEQHGRRPARPSTQWGGSLVQRLSPLPGWATSLASYALAVLAVGFAVAVFLWLLMRVPLVTYAVVAALLLAALLQPLTDLLSRHAPRWVAALVTVLLLVFVPVSLGYVVVRRAVDQLDNLRSALTDGLNQLRTYATHGTLSLSEQRYDEVRQQVTTTVTGIVPSPQQGAMLALTVVSGFLIALFLLFFFLKDGPGMWRWAVSWAPERRRQRFDGSGVRAWKTLTHYVRGTVVVALIDAIGIGAGLFVLGVPLALSLTVITFFGAFVPLVGATVSGGLAIVVTLVTQGVHEALIVLAIVLLVQQLEGNVLQPFIMGHQLRLHPVAILVAVTVGGLVAGIGGAVVAVPTLAVVYRVASYLAGREQQATSEDSGRAGPDEGGSAADDEDGGSRRDADGGGEDGRVRTFG